MLYISVSPCVTTGSYFKLRLLLALWIGLLTSQAHAELFANSQGDFSTASQGQRGWQYGYYTEDFQTPGYTTRTFGTFSTATSVATPEVWIGEESNGSLSHSATDMLPGIDTGRPVVRRYTVGAGGETAFSGTVRVVGYFYDQDAAGQKNGFITVDGQNKFVAPIQGARPKFDFTVTVSPGSKIDFGVNVAGDGSYNDTTGLFARIATPDEILPSNLVASAHVSPDTRQGAFVLATNTVKGTDDEQSFVLNPVTAGDRQFAGLLYLPTSPVNPKAVRFNTIRVDLGAVTAEGGNFAAPPELYILKNRLDPGMSNPAASQSGYAKVALTPTAGSGSYTFDFSGRTEEERTGWGFAVVGTGGGTEHFINISELGAFAEEATITPTPVTPFTVNYNGHSYALTLGSGTWNQAETEAVSYGGHLVAIENPAENDFLVRTFGAAEEFYIGFRKVPFQPPVPSSYFWNTGEAVTYMNWLDGQPDDSVYGNDVVTTNHLGAPGQWGNTGTLDDSPLGLYRGLIEFPTLGPADNRQQSIPITANIFGSGKAAELATPGGGTPAVSVTIPSGGAAVSFSNITGTINTGGHISGPDGVGPDAGVSVDIQGVAGVSGFIDHGNGPSLVGVFLRTTAPTDPQPPRLDFSPTALGHNFEFLSPAIGQVFFIGDGKTSTGTVQRFTVPAGATRLFLGIPDAYEGAVYQGNPGYYDDNTGSLTAQFSFELGTAIGLSAPQHFSINTKQPSATGRNWTFLAEHASEQEGLTLTVETSTDLVNWTPLGTMIRQENEPTLWALETSAIPTGLQYFRATAAVNGSTASALYPDDVQPLAENVGTLPPVPPAEDLQILVAGKKNVFTGKSGQAWKFVARQLLEKSLPGLSLKAQWSATPDVESSWQDVAGGQMTRVSPTAVTWSVQTQTVHSGTIYFRTLTSADDRAPSAGPRSGAYTVAAGPLMRVTATVQSESNRNGTSTYPGEILTYTFTCQNVGSGTASGVNLEVLVPAKTFFASATDNPVVRDARERLVSDDTGVRVTWDLQNVPTLATVVRKLMVRVDDTLDVLKQRVPLKLNTGKVRLSATGLPNVSIPENLDTYVGAPLDISITRDKARALPGEVVTYTINARNLAGFAITNAVISQRLPLGTTFESAPLINSAGAPGTVFTTLTTNSNPSLTPYSTITRQMLAWKIASIGGGQTVSLSFSVRVLYDVPAYIFQNGVGSTSAIEASPDELTFTALNAQNKALSVSTYTKEAVRTLILDGDVAQPDLRLHKTAFARHNGVAGFGGGTLRTPFADEDGRLLYNYDAVSVLPFVSNASTAGLVTYELAYANEGAVTAKDATIVEVLPEGYTVPSPAGVRKANAGYSTFTGFVYLNGAPLARNRYVLKDGGGAIIPEGADVRATRSMEFNVGDLRPQARGILSYEIAATVPAAAVGTAKGNPVIMSRGYAIRSRSLAAPSPGTPDGVAVVVVKPISWELEPESYVGDARNTPARVRGKVPPGGDFYYVISYRNLGSASAQNSTLHVRLPAGLSKLYTLVNEADVTANSVGETGQISVPVGVVAGGASGEVVIGARLLPLTDRRFPPALRASGTDLALEADDILMNWIYPAAQSFARSLYSTVAAPAVPQGSVPAGTGVTQQVDLGPSPALWLCKSAPFAVAYGSRFTYIFVVGNAGEADAQGVKLELLTPFGTSNPTATPGASDVRNVKGFKIGSNESKHLTWNLGTIRAHEVKAVTLELTAIRDGDYLNEDSAEVTATNFGLSIGAGIARSKVNKTAFGAQVSKAFDMFFAGKGFSFAAGAQAALAADVRKFNEGSRGYHFGNVHAVPLNNGVTIVQNLGNQVVVFGPRQLITYSGAGLIGQEGGNIVAAGAGNLVNVRGLGTANFAPLNADNLAGFVTRLSQGLIGQEGGNILANARGANNLISNDSASLRRNDTGAGAGFIEQRDAGSASGGPARVIAAGAGNVVAGGAGNILTPAAVVAAGAGNIKPGPGGTVIAAGAGNIVAAGAGNLKAGLASGIVAAGAGNIISNDSASLISNDSASLNGRAGNIVAAGAGNIVAAGAGN